MRPILSLRSRVPVHAITIEVEPFGFGFDVRVLPTPVGIGHDREHRTLDDARRYAALLSKATGWRVIDNAGNAG